jgi:DNA-directed RNA polymerase specialized sigma24 family protein
MSDPPLSPLQVSLEQFTALLDRGPRPLYTFLRGIVGDDEQARDLMQDTFYDAWCTAQQGIPPSDSACEEEACRRRWLFHTY